MQNDFKYLLTIHTELLVSCNRLIVSLKPSKAEIAAITDLLKNERRMHSNDEIAYERHAVRNVGEGSLHIWGDPRYRRIPALRYEFDPSVVRVASVKQFFDEVHPHLFRATFSRGEVAQFNLAMDIFGHRFDDLLFYRKGIRMWNKFPTFPAIDLGDAVNAMQITALDMQYALRRGPGNVLFDGNSVRVEFRLGKKTHIKKLAQEISDYADTFFVGRIGSNADATVRRCQDIGVNEVLKGMTPKDRAALMKKLQLIPFKEFIGSKNFHDGVERVINQIQGK